MNSTPSRAQWFLAVLVAALTAVLVTWWSRDLWFFSDLWDYVGKRDGSFESIMRQHAGHWTMWTAMLVQTLVRIYGMDFFPAYVAPLTIAYAAYSIALWRILIWRGVNATVSLAFVALLGLLAAGAWQNNVAYIGGILVQTAALLIATIIEREPDSRVSLIAISALLVLAITSSGGGLALLAAFLVVSVLNRRPSWLLLAVPAVVLYGWWWSVFGRTTATSLAPRLELISLLRLPRVAFEILSGGAAAFFTISGAFAIVALLIIVIVVVSRWIRYGYDNFDLMMTLSLGAFVGLVALVRVGSGGFSATLPQYSSAVIAYAVPVVLPKFQLPNRIPRTQLVRGMVIVGFVAFVAVNAMGLRAGLESRSTQQQRSRSVAIAVAQMVDDGEPFLPFASISHQLSAGTIQRLVLLHPGWFTDQVPPESVQAGRGRMRTSIRSDRGLEGEPLMISADVNGDGCVSSSPNGQLFATVGGAGHVEIFSDAGATIDIEWRDEFGEGFRRSIVRGNQSNLNYSGPEGAGLIIKSPSGSTIKLCGLGASASLP